MRYFLAFFLFCYGQVALASGDGALGDFVLLYVDQLQEQTKNICLARDLANMPATLDAWDRWTKTNANALEELKEARGKLTMAMKARAVDLKSNAKIPERVAYFSGIETLGAVASTSLLSMLASEEDSQIKGFCSMSRERWMSTDTDPVLTTAIRELRKGLLEVEKAK